MTKRKTPEYHTPKTLAAATGVSGQTIRNLVERGALKPDADTVVGGMLFLPIAEQTVRDYFALIANRQP